MDEVFLNNFKALCAIPHGTHHEEALGQYILERALSKGLTARRDAIGNVILEREAAAGFENAPVTVLQAHMDMVTVARPGSGWDPLRDGPEPVREGDMLRAKRSSLGGDDCSGVALIQELMEDETLRCGALRGIITVDEEQGMSGAKAMAPEELRGSYLINLDWEESGRLCCASAGSETFYLRFPYALHAYEGEGITLRLHGLMGGHSGMEIHKGRCNALRALAEMLSSMFDSGIPVRIASFTGGNANNAIPCEAAATLLLPIGKTESFQFVIRDKLEELRERFAGIEPQMLLDMELCRVEKAWSFEDTEHFLSCLCSLKLGVNSWVESIPGLVESSANLGQAFFNEAGAAVTVMQRSCAPAVTEQMMEKYRRQADRAGADMDILSSTPPWPMKADSRLQRLCMEKFTALTGREMERISVHAGLETSCWAVANPELDCISIGPNIYDIHTPSETLDLKSCDLLHDLVEAMLREIAKE